MKVGNKKYIYFHFPILITYAPGCFHPFRLSTRRCAAPADGRGALRPAAAANRTGVCESRGKPSLTHHNEAEILPERLFKQKQRDGAPRPLTASLTSSQRPRGSYPAPTNLPTYPPLSASLLVKLKSLYVHFFLDFNLATSTLFPTAAVSGFIITCLCFSSTLPNCL